MKGIGQTILKQYEDMGAIKNVDYDADFNIDESLSGGDEVYFIVAISARGFCREAVLHPSRPAKAAGGKLCSTTKNPISLREGHAFIDGVEVMDGVKMNINFSPEVWTGRS